MSAQQADEFSAKQIEQLQKIIVDPLKRYVDQKFAKNDEDHSAMRAQLSELTGDVAEIKHDVRRLDEERLVMVHRQDKLEKLRS